MELAVIDGGLQQLRAEYRRKNPAMLNKRLGKDEMPFGIGEFLTITYGLETVLHEYFPLSAETITTYKAGLPNNSERLTDDQFNHSSRIEHLIEEARLENDEFEKTPNGTWVKTTYDRRRPRIITVEGDKIPKDLYQELLTTLETYNPHKALGVVKHQTR